MYGLLDVLQYAGAALVALLLLYIALRVGTLAVLTSIAEFRNRPPRLSRKVEP